MKVVFSVQFKADLLREEAQYAQVSDKLASALRERIAGQAREVIKWKGGGHVGPHGFPCRRTKPFPFYIYYKVQEETIYFLGLVHERLHPKFFKGRMKTPGAPDA